MAYEAGEIVNDRAIVQVVVAGTTITKGQVVNRQLDNKWDPVVDAGQGPFGVAIEAAVDTEEVRIVVEGEVTVLTDEAIKLGQIVDAATTGAVGVAGVDASGNYVKPVARAMEDIGSAAVGIIKLGLIS